MWCICHSPRVWRGTIKKPDEQVVMVDGVIVCCCTSLETSHCCRWFELNYSPLLCPFLPFPHSFAVSLTNLSSCLWPLTGAGGLAYPPLLLYPVVSFLFLSLCRWSEKLLFLSTVSCTYVRVLACTYLSTFWEHPIGSSNWEYLYGNSLTIYPPLLTHAPFSPTAYYDHPLPSPTWQTYYMPPPLITYTLFLPDSVLWSTHPLESSLRRTKICWRKCRTTAWVCRSVEGNNFMTNSAITPTAAGTLVGKKQQQ